MRSESDFSPTVAWIIRPNPDLRHELDRRANLKSNTGHKEAYDHANKLVIRFLSFFANKPLLESEFDKLRDMWSIWFDLSLIDEIAQQYSINFGIRQNGQSGFVMLGIGDLAELERLDVTEILEMCYEELDMHPVSERI